MSRVRVHTGRVDEQARADERARADEQVRVDVRVEGLVQGVGFRPFVYGLAVRLGLAGCVGNDANGVFVEAEGASARVEEFLVALEREAPPLARVDRISVVPRAPAKAGIEEPDGSGARRDERPGKPAEIGGEAAGIEGGERGGGAAGAFTIVDSDASGRPRALVSPDGATCADCLRELADPGDRRFGYAFVNCTNCGPRFTIVRGVPYDRPLTTMAGFAMCAACAAEYHDPADRRFHAQPVCCPDCGPRLRLLDSRGAELPGDPVGGCAGLLRAGRVVAVKGLGGYHLAALASDEDAVAALRRRKHREDKPFAVMAADLEQAGLLCEVDAPAAALLADRARPIVLLQRRAGAPVAASAAPGNRRLGVMLPYTPLHHLLLAAVAEPIVLTSGNVSDEPIVHRDSDALARLGGIADAFLTHDRPIHVRTDDSVVRPFRGRGSVLRRSRGYVPDPVELRRTAPRPILACGAELKSTFCLAEGDRAFVSHHIGDLENYETLRSFTEGVEHFSALFGIRPRVVAHDLHPEYLSTKYAVELADTLEDAELVGVQHHHAHIASCLADNGEPGPVLGVAFDGLGLGPDGTVWGGEFLLAGLTSFERAGHLAPVPMPGGTAAIRQPWRMAAAYLQAAYGGQAPEELAVAVRNRARWTDVLALTRAGVNSPLTSSAGRLFDAVSALLGLRDAITYEGQAAIELEQHADPAERGRYRASISPGGPLVVAGADLVRAAAEDLLAGTDPAVIAARFHNGVADLVVRCCVALRDATGVRTAALSGGVFQNLLLLERAVDGLSAAGFRVLTHSRVPANDGGISLGQAAVAAARDRLRG
ncbi:carbamoyltransferase HypF [Planobispora siamensis]|uniref:Carbamoyltransferase n=1 Tax=Planobispora siamensis TaxID=936338 RepID=A0A8J3SFZ2_9ACTN|nr:carbamoyltransferase HypF [Planobispora siamensis]GIH93548.1 carbamoyltransferase [Planobispora siamensis]